MFKPFQCILISEDGVELQGITLLFLLIMYHCHLAMNNQHLMTKLSPIKYAQAGSNFESEYLASKLRIKMSIIMLIRKPISKQFLKL